MPLSGVLDIGNQTNNTAAKDVEPRRQSSVRRRSTKSRFEHYRTTDPIFAIVAPLVIEGTAHTYNTIPASGERASNMTLPT